MRIRPLFSLVAGLMICSCASGVALAQSVTRIGGHTMSWNGKEYVPLPKVTVTIIRNGNLVDSKESDGADARYDVEADGGAPLELIYHFNDDYVPVVQGVAAGDGMSHEVSTALLTVGQYEELRRENKGMPTVQERVAMVLILLRGVSDDTAVVQDMLRMAPNSR